MERLKRIIGKAPSECSKEELLERVGKERKRVGETLERYLSKPWQPRKGRGKAPAKPTKTVAKLLEGLGLSEEEFLEAKRELEELKREKEQKKP